MEERSSLVLVRWIFCDTVPWLGGLDHCPAGPVMVSQVLVYPIRLINVVRLVMVRLVLVRLVSVHTTRVVTVYRLAD